MGKEEIARYEQFLLFPQCFQKVSLCGNGLNDHGFETCGRTNPDITNALTLSQTSSLFMCLQYMYKSFENTVGKGEITCNEECLLSPVFSTLLAKFFPFSSNLKLLSSNSFNLEESKICCLVKS